MTDLAGEPSCPAVQPTAEDDTRADPGPDAEIDEVLDLAEQSPLADPGSCGPDVVLDRARHPETPLELLAQRKSVPAEIDRQRHDAGNRVDASGHADADGGHAVD